MEFVNLLKFSEDTGVSHIMGIFAPTVACNKLNAIVIKPEIECVSARTWLSQKLYNAENNAKM